MNRTCWFLLCAPLWAQSLQILPAPPSGKHSGTFRIMLVSHPPRSPAAIRWRIAVGPGVTVAPQDVVEGSAAEQAKKRLACAASKDGQGVVCVVAGGREPIPDGALAAVRFTVPAATRQALFRLDGVMGATRDGSALPMANVTVSFAFADADK